MKKLPPKKTKTTLKPSTRHKKVASVSWLGQITEFFQSYLKIKRTKGFTMIEVLIAMTILSVMTIGGIVNVQRSQGKARDAERKTDLSDIKTAFENYYNDNDCYPPETVLQNCGGEQMRPYLSEIPCDPGTDQPYLYMPLPDRCDGYRVHAGLENVNDTSIESIGCNAETGCGYGAGYNYGISAGVAVYDSNAEPVPMGSASPSPSASGPIYFFACDASGTCNRYEQGHPALASCPVTFQASNCNNECGNPALRCN